MPSFEEAMTRIEAIISSLEEGDIPLDELLAKYEEGTRMIKLAETYLKNAELKIDQLKNSDDKPFLEPFELKNVE